MPFSKHACFVAGGLGDFGDGEFFWIEASAVSGQEDGEFFAGRDVLHFDLNGGRDIHVDAGGVASGHEGGAGGSAEGCGDVEAGETRTFFCHLVDVGRVDVFAAEAAEVGVALVVGEDDDEVGAARACTSPFTTLCTVVRSRACTAALVRRGGL